MNEAMTVQLNRMYMVIDFMGDLENQDTDLTLEMSQAMLNDIIENGELKEIIEYVKRYCDVIDEPDDINRIVSEIMS